MTKMKRINEKNYFSQTDFNSLSKNTEKLVEILNHRVTTIENDLRWVKRIGYYMAAGLTTIVIKSVFIR